MPAPHDPLQDLILVPGLLCTPALYAPQLPALAKAARVTVADHTRHESMAEIARAVLAGAPARFALCGLSMGGYIALEMMRQAPQRVTRLALLDTSAKPDTPARSAARRAQVAQAGGAGLASIADALMPFLVHPRRLSDPVLVATITKMATDLGVTVFGRQQTAIAGRADSRPGLPAISVPTLVLVGREDVLTPVDAAEEIAGGIPGSRLRIIEDCGHLSTLEQPDAVTAALLAWLEA